MPSPCHQRQSVAATSLDALPVEILIDILQCVNIESLDAISKTSRRLNKIIEANWTVILRPVITREMAPVSSFMLVLGACSSKAVQETRTPPPVHGSNQPDDQPFPDDESDNESIGDADDDLSDDDVDEDGDDASTGTLGSIDDVLSIEATSSTYSVDGHSRDTLPDQWATGLLYADIMHACRTVKRWEQEFHRHRFACPHYRRTLQQHELRRLRHGLYAWWRYSYYFHDTSAFVGDENQNVDSPAVRMSFVRQFSTSQLHEIRDMWETIKSAVGREVCPSVSAVRQQSGNVLSWVEAARVGWGDVKENRQVLRTIMKLQPEEILFLLVNRHRFATKASIIQFARLKNPWIEDSVETFSDAIQWALWERERQLVAEYGQRALHRRWYFPRMGFFPRPWGGIADYKRPETEQLRGVYSRDTGAGTRYWIDDHGGPWRYMSMLVPRGRLIVSGTTWVS
ncbi:hypothetical protein B0T18DRAFT_217662 [Schizothecium vesticola]|uniref:F-box domain-containing protein n=1 Tax=Schizothecium vesticola TaxID=314040 RepID=A0AA40EK26_9PEZI|nr:hypothetical protein B0T18DRAFT_217662 [Schizothecium vesticola]